MPRPGIEARWPALRSPAFRRLLLARLATVIGTNALIVAVGWQVYDIGRSAFQLGLIGLVQFLPAILLIPVTGTVADRYPRRTVIAIGLLVMALCAGALLAISLAGIDVVWPFLAILTLFGTCRAFLNPAHQSLIPNLVPVRHLGNAVAITTITGRAGQAIGPLAGGMLYGISAGVAHAAVLATFLAGAALAATIPRPAKRIAAPRISLQSLTAGFNYIWNTRAMLGAISLDVFAILLGGATALLPIFARDILDAGPSGLGILRGAPAVGGMAVALYLSVWSIRNSVGVTMFATVAVFGAATAVFGLSTNLWLSALALVVMGGSDVASAYIRWTLVQIWTPDEVRGRVSAVSSVSASGSTELGEFRAGSMAAAFGAVPAVVFGGVAIIGIVALWIRWFPELLRVRHFDRPV